MSTGHGSSGGSLWWPCPCSDPLPRPHGSPAHPLNSRWRQLHFHSFALWACNGRGSHTDLQNTFGVILPLLWKLGPGFCLQMTHFFHLMNNTRLELVDSYLITSSKGNLATPLFSPKHMCSFLPVWIGWGFFFLFFFVCFYATGSCYVVQASPVLMILPPQSPKCWNCKCVPPCFAPKFKDVLPFWSVMSKSSLFCRTLYYK